MKPPIHISQASSWSLMELAPFPFGRLPGLHRASPSTPLDAYSYVRCSIPIVRQMTNRRQRGGERLAPSWGERRPFAASCSR